MNNWQKARARMMTQHAFFATLMMSTKTVETRDIPTLATDMVTIWYNPDFIDTLSVEQIMYAIAHEVLHIALDHSSRLRSRNPRLWNIACDYAINLTLVDSGFKFIEGTLLDRKYTGMSADQIYERVEQQSEKQRKARSRSGQGQGDGQGQGQGQGDGLDEDVLGQDLKPMSGTADEQAKAQRSVQQRVAQAATMARMCGQLSGDLERLIGEILDPKVPWLDMLRHLMSQTAQDDESWGRRNRRFSDLYLPSRHSERMGEVIMIGDTSGSISNDELGTYVSEAASLADQLRPERIRFVWADTKVAGEQVFEAGDDIVAEPKGHGGTDMRVPLEYVAQYDPVVVVLFTDGYSPFPSCEPPYPLIVCCTTNVPIPVGNVVRI